MIGRSLLRSVLFGLAASALWGCFESGGGTGTETESAFGEIKNQDGSPAVGARVILRPDDYVTDSSVAFEENLSLREAVTDREGRFGFDTLHAGAFRIEVADDHGKGMSRRFTLDEEDHLELSPGILVPTGAITGTVVLDSLTRSQRIYVQVYGMERLVVADSATGKFTVPDMPPGYYRMRFVGPKAPVVTAILENVVVEEGQSTQLPAPVALQGDTKMTFSVGPNSLTITGLGDNPRVIFDNEKWDNGVDDEYVWSRASAGLITLRGNIVTNGARVASNSMVDDQMAKCLGELKLAQLAGMDGIPAPVAGSRRVLINSGTFESAIYERSPGSDLIVAEAKAPGVTPANPLVVVVGGPATTVANAYLSDTTIADNIIVMPVLQYNINTQDPFSTYIVTKKMRCVHWGWNYSWTKGVETADSASIALLPGNWMGQQVRAYLVAEKAKVSTLGKITLGDLAPVAYLVNHSLWKSAAQARIAYPLQSGPASSLAFDFLDIPVDANDWAGYKAEFFGALKAQNGATYHARPVPGALQAEGFFDAPGTRLLFTTPPVTSTDSAYGFAAVTIDQNKWCDYLVDAAPGAYTATFHYRAPQGATLTIGPAGAPLATVALPAASDWRDAADSLAVKEGGKTTWRIIATQGSVDLDSLVIK